jgi:cyclopropane-fatty-acyl-phospholipid synthase
VDATLRFLQELFGRSPLRNVAVCLWDGSIWPDETPKAATFVLQHPGALRQMFGAATEKALAEAYLHEDFDIFGDIESAFEVIDALADGRGWKQSLALAYLLRALPESTRAKDTPNRFLRGHGRRRSRERTQQAISHHYDVSNDFYRLWLDQKMVYSCAYFETPEQNLDAAQTAKLDYLCRKLRLKAGQRLLDVGCGWGGLALHAARRYGVKVTGVTLSQQQAEWASARVQEAGLADRVTIRLRDYRDLSGEEPFDAAVSVGMAEHVGGENLPEYFKTVYDLLKPGGVFLNHAIGKTGRYPPDQGPSFLKEYVFPDSDIPPIPAVLEAAEPAGFEVRDVENLREHYTLTLRHWVRRLEDKQAEALGFVDEMTYRVWRLYLAGSAYGFNHGWMAVYQTLLSKGDRGGRAHLPLTRQDWQSAG